MSKKIIHTINVLIGIFTIGFSLFFTWGVLAFGPEGNMLIVAFPLVVIAIWSIIYYLQIKFQTIKSFVILLLVELILLFLVVLMINLN